MKKVAALLLAPYICFASHSVEVGGFYSVHKEKGYLFNLGGPSLSYEIGNTKGLKARGKLLTSNNSDLLFIRSQSELLWYLPIAEYHLVPFFGGHVTHHNVYRRKGATGVLTRTYAPLGVGFSHDLEEISYEFRIGHMHALGSTYVYEELGMDNFRGRHFTLPHGYLVDGKVQYQTTDRINVGVSASWVSDYRQKIKEWTAQGYLNLSF